MNRQIMQIVLCAFVGLSGCAALQQKPQRDEAALQTIRKAAIVSFSVFQQEPVELSLDIGRLGLGANAGGSMIAKESAHSQQLELVISFFKLYF
jgi:hypothetical protein